MNEFAAELQNVSFRYGNSEEGALHGVDLRITPGECILLCGASGCGKTTVTRLLNGLIPHDHEGELQGRITVFGRDIGETAIEELAGTVGSVFQNPRSQFFCVDTTAEIAFGCENMGLPEAEIRDRVRKTVSQMHIEPLLHRSIFKLSGGEKQKIACAGVAAMLPRMIVLDEPTSNLDLDAIAELCGIIAAWKAQGKTIVIAEHRLYWLRGLCDRVLRLDRGEIRDEFTGDAFFSLPEERLHEMGLRAVSAGRNYLETKTGLSALTDASFPDTITLEDLRCCYGRQEALHIDRLELPRGAVIAVVGHNGAGKSTFTRCLCGLQKSFKGSVSIGGKRVKPKDRMRMSYMVMQDVNHQLFAETVLEEVMLGADETAEQRTLELLERLDILAFRERHPMSLSGGQKQRTAVASALLAGKEILVFDEPTSGLDFRSMESAAGLLSSLQHQCTVLIVTHDTELIDRCCTHILHIENGRV